MARMSLPLDLIVDITSTSVKDSFMIGKLNTLCINKYDPNNPQPKFVEAHQLSDIIGSYGLDSDMYGFGSVYFGIISKSATRADTLYIYNWSKEDVPALLRGARIPLLDNIQGLNGAFNLSINGITRPIELDFNNVDSFSTAAEILQDAIQSAGVGLDEKSAKLFSEAKAYYSPITQGFTIVSGGAGEGSTISFALPLAEPTITEVVQTFNDIDETQDIHDLLGLTQDEGAISEVGYNGLETLSDVLADIEGNNGNYYVLTTSFKLDNVRAELHEFGKFLNASNDRFLGVYSWDSKAIITTKGFTKEFQGYNGLVIDYQTMPYQQALVCGYISAMELNNPSGNYNIAFNDATIFSGNALTETIHYQNLVDNKANAPCKFGILGQDDTIYMDGTCMGAKTNSINIYCANSFIKMNQQIALFNMFKSQKMIAVRGRQTQGIVRAYLDDVFTKAVKANIICRGATLTVAEVQMVKNTFVDYVDDLDQLVRDIENNGYFYAVTNFDLVNKTMNIVEAYVANTPAKKIIVNIYILGA